MTSNYGEHKQLIFFGDIRDFLDTPGGSRKELYVKFGISRVWYPVRKRAPISGERSPAGHP